MELINIDLPLPELDLDFSIPDLPTPDLDISLPDIDATIAAMEAQFSDTATLPETGTTPDTTLPGTETTPEVPQPLIDTINQIGAAVLQDTVEQPLLTTFTFSEPGPITEDFAAPLLISSPLETISEPLEIAVTDPLLDNLLEKLDTAETAQAETELPTKEILLTEEAESPAELITGQRAFYDLIQERGGKESEVTRLSLDIISPEGDHYADTILAVSLPSGMNLIYHTRTSGDTEAAAAAQLVAVSSLEGYLGSEAASHMVPRPAVIVHWRNHDHSYDIRWHNPASIEKFPKEVEKSLRKEFRKDWKAQTFPLDLVHVTNETEEFLEDPMPDDENVIKTAKDSVTRAYPLNPDRPSVLRR